MKMQPIQPFTDQSAVSNAFEILIDDRILLNSRPLIWLSQKPLCYTPNSQNYRSYISAAWNFSRHGESL